MKKLILCIMLLFCLTVSGQNNIKEGVYKQTKQGTHTIILIKDGYVSETKFKDNTYISTRGGIIQPSNQAFIVLVEYNDVNPAEVGKQINMDLKGYSKQKSIKQDLDALWRITGRMQGDKMHTIPLADRKTIKILVDGYFQWIAINPVEKGFYGTGGGKYTFNDKQYTEEIIFFFKR